MDDDSTTVTSRNAGRLAGVVDDDAAWLSCRLAARLAGVDRRSIRWQARQGRIRSREGPRGLLFFLADVATYRPDGPHRPPRKD